MKPIARLLFQSLSIFCAAYGAAPPSKPVVPLTALSLEQCFALATDHNASITSAVDAIKATNGEELSAISRFLPHLYLAYHLTRTDSIQSNSSEDHNLNLELHQRIAEFGQTSDVEFTRLRTKYQTASAHEAELINDFSAIRVSYFSLRIIQDQLITHDSLLAIYQTNLDEAKSRLDKGVGHKPAMLQARLSFLDEKERILDLIRQKNEQLAALRELLGGFELSDSIRLTTAQSSIHLGIDTCIARAIRNNTDISDARNEAELAKRTLVEQGWTLAPDMVLSAGYQSGSNSASLQLSNNLPDSRHTWALDAVGSHALISSSQPLSNQYDLESSPFVFDTSARFSASLAVSLPLFEGLKRKGDAMEAGALYNKARDMVLVKTHDMERQVLVAFHDYQLSLEGLDIQKEEVDIAREQYDLALDQRDVGKISDVDVDVYRRDVFSAQDTFFSQQFDVLQKEEALRKLVRQFEE